MSGAVAEAEDQEFLGMSDDDFAALNTTEIDSEFLDIPEDSDDQEEAMAQVEEGEEASDDEDLAAPEAAEPEGSQAEEEAISEEEEASEPEEQEEEELGEEETPDQEVEATSQDFFAKVTSPFKANGRDMKVDNADDVIKLMQMGANYNRKMAAMKPGLKVLKMLENNELLDAEKIGFLIDINKKDPAAIAKLLADSEIDPVEFDLDQGADYKTADHSVDERELALDEVAEELKDSPNYAKTVELVATKWDAESKQAVANDPQLLKVIDSHMASGIYELISNELEQERTFGRLNGMSDIEAYGKIGDAIEARGGFDHLFPAKGQRQQDTTQAKKQKPDTAAANKTRRDKRRAASSSRSSASQEKAAVNPLGLSDDDFAKQFDESLLN